MSIQIGSTDQHINCPIFELQFESSYAEKPNTFNKFWTDNGDALAVKQVIFNLKVVVS